MGSRTQIVTDDEVVDGMAFAKAHLEKGRLLLSTNEFKALLARTLEKLHGPNQGKLHIARWNALKELFGTRPGMYEQRTLWWKTVGHAFAKRSEAARAAERARIAHAEEYSQLTNVH